MTIQVLGNKWFWRTTNQRLLAQACHGKNDDRGAADHGHFYLAGNDPQGIFGDSLDVELAVGVDVHRVLLLAVLLVVVHVQQHGQCSVHAGGLLHPDVPG